jgi:hypothetical protein
MAMKARWRIETRSMINTENSTSDLAAAMLGTTRARSFSRSGFVCSLLRRFQSRTVDASCIPTAIDGFRVVFFKVGPRRAWLCPAPFKKVSGSAASAPRLDSLPCSAGSGQGRSLRLRLAPEPNESINQTPISLRGFGSLAALGAGYFRCWASFGSGN